MKNWTKEQLIFATTSCIAEGGSIVRAQRHFKRKFQIKAAPSYKVIKRCMANFSSSGNLDKPNPGHRPITATNATNLDKSINAIEENPNISVRRLAQHIGASVGSTHKIMRKKLSLTPYKVQICQQLQDGDYERRVRFCKWLKEKAVEDPDFLGNLITSDEAHFSLDGSVNRQNFRFWAKENPKEIREVPLHSSRVTVWCAFTSASIIGPFFFENENEQAITVNGDRYGDMLREYFIPLVDSLDLVEPFFQQDGATCHTTRPNMEVLKNRFPGKLISRFGDIEWPARSPDLSPLDFFLWGYLKGKVYRNKPQSVDELKNAIRTEISLIGQDVLQKVMENMLKRAESCVASGGRHMKDIVFSK